MFPHHFDEVFLCYYQEFLKVITIMQDKKTFNLMNVPLFNYLCLTCPKTIPQYRYFLGNFLKKHPTLS